MNKEKNKIKIIIGILVLLMILIVFYARNYNNNQNEIRKKSSDNVTEKLELNLEKITNSAKSIDDLTKNFIIKLSSKDTMGSAKLILSGVEYSSIFSALPDNDGNPNTKKFLTSFHVSSNSKHLKRWLEIFDKDKIVLDSISTPSQIIKVGDIKIHKGFYMYFTKIISDKKLEHIKLNPFNSVIETKRGFKILTLLDTKNM